ncbi:hypothetical protein AB0K51_01395 [Kitasatospora sp. NPDC049285]|uniref:hypothetical protein n=1 Tax=Kitasatospora sp. NPDC049285 TaxID=3157096 RepID=UPI00341AD8E7
MTKADWDWAAEARALERAAADARPEDRLAFLSQAGEHFATAGAYDRAVELLRSVAEQSGDPDDAASPVLAYALLRAGREEEGRAVAAAAQRLTDRRADWREHRELAGHLDRAGLLPEALANYDTALALVLRLAEPDAPLPDAPGLRPLSQLSEERRTVRERLGLPPDDHDRAALRRLPALKRWRLRRSR